MIAPRVGLFLGDGRLTVVAVTGRDRVERFVIADSEDLAGALAAELGARRLATRRIRVGLDRRLAVVKILQLPRAAGGDLAQMVGFDLERHVPFPPEDVRFDWTELPSKAETPRRVLMAACERRGVERPLGLLAAAKRRPAALTVACHDLTALLPRALPPERVAWAHRHGSSTDLLFLRGRRLLMSRTVAVEDPEGLAREIARSLPLVQWTRYHAVWISGDEASAWRAAPGLAAALDAPVAAPPYAPSRAALIARLPEKDPGAALLALAVACAPRRPLLDLLPAEARPWTLSRERMISAGLAIITVLLGLTLAYTHALKTEHYLAHLTQEIRRLEPEAKAAEGLSAELVRKKRILASLRAAEGGRVQALPILRELTDTLPASAWVQSLTLSREGVELTGQADAASALIPLLEASSWLERVEFTSPVTKAQSKEQFRLRAGWETPSPLLPPVGRRPGEGG